MRRSVALVALAALAGCGGDPPPTTTPDATVDAPDGARPDAAPDVAADAAPDLPPPMDAPAPDVAEDVDAGPPPLVCEPLRLEPTTARVATGRSMLFRALGGSGRGALFAFAPGAMTGGASLSVGGSFVAGPRAASFEVVATDMPCNASVRARVEVVGPFTLQPGTVRIAPGRTMRFVTSGALGTVRWELLQRPTGGNATLDPMGNFNSGSVQGIYRVRATDAGGGGELQSTVTVAAGTTFAAGSDVVLVPRGRRVRLTWRGGSGHVNASVVGGTAGGAIAGAVDDVMFDATTARAGTATVMATDRYTNERATVRVVVGEEVAPAPVPRGPVTFVGDSALGDLNADGRVDLVIGHANRSETGNETGGVLVFYGQADGRYRAQPDVVLNGERDNDLFGANVLVTDVDGDRIDDLVVASPNQDLGRDGRGSVQVFLGARAGLVREPERTLVGETNGDAFGTNVVLEDLDRDGARDLVVAAGNAANPFNAMCGRAGRVYVFRATPGVRGLFMPVPWQVIDVRDRLDDNDGPAQCRAGNVAGSGLALLDMDGDGARDLVIGAPGSGAPNFGSVLVHRGVMMPGATGPFDMLPSWAIHMAAAQRTNNPRLGFGLDVVPCAPNMQCLVARVPTFGQNAMGASTSAAGAFFVFRPNTLGARPAMGEVRVLTTSIAAARFTGSAVNELVGRAGAVADVDGDGDAEYLVGAGDRGFDGSLFVFDASALGAGGTLTPTATVRGETSQLEALGFRIAVGRAATGSTAPLAVMSAYRTTASAFGGGSLRVLPGGARMAFMDRWAAGFTQDIPVLPSADRTGAALALGALRGATAGDLVVASPGAHSPAVPMMGTTPARPAGFTGRTGAADVMRTGEATPFQRYWVNRTGAGFGTAIAVLDFDGDGRQDVAVGDPGETAGGNDMIGRANPRLPNALNDPCWLRTNNTNLANTSPAGRGIVRVYLQQADGSLAERFWAIGREVVAPGGTVRRAGFGFSVANAGDVNGDGIADLLVGRNGSLGSNGAEVVLGQRADAMGRITVVCNDPAAAPWWDSRADNTTFGVTVAGVGDLDDDGCADTAASISGNGRAGLSVQYGFGPACRRNHRTRHELLVVPDDRPLRANETPPGGTPRPVANRVADWADLPGAPTGMGLVLAGGVDLNGDRVPDIAVRDAALQWRDLVGPAVEILSGAWLNGLCPEHVCAAGLDERFYSDGMGYNVVGVRTVPAPQRLIVPGPSPSAVRFGAALAALDLDGDGGGELVVGAPDDSQQGDFAGAVMAWRASSDQESFVARPWLFGVGDVAERSLFGSALAVSRDAGGTWLAVGAQFSNHRGAQTGAAYRWRIDR